MVLESIYGPQFAVVSEDCVRLSLELPSECAVSTRQEVALLVEATRLQGGAQGGGRQYPDVPPLVTVSCAGLASGALRHLTRVVAQVRAQGGGHGARQRGPF